MDHHQFDEDLLDKATKAILKTRDGLLRAAVPSPLGSCVFINDVTHEQMVEALHKHKELMKSYPRNGEGLEAYVDSSDTGYTKNSQKVEKTEKHQNGNTNGHTDSAVINDDTTEKPNGKMNGEINGVASHKKAMSHASGPEGVDGTSQNA